MSPLFLKCHVAAWRPIKPWLVRSLLASAEFFVGGITCLQFASEMSCQALEACRWLNLSPCFDIAVADYWQSIGKALQVFVSSGSPAINYVPQVLTHITLCCHSLREMTLMSLSLKCSLIAGSLFLFMPTIRKKYCWLHLIKLRSGIHKTIV